MTMKTAMTGGRDSRRMRRFFKPGCYPMFMPGVLVAGMICTAYAQAPERTSSPFRIEASAYQRLVDENLELRREQARREAEAGELRRRNASLLVDVQDLERRNNQFAVVMAQLKTPEDIKTEVARLESEKQGLIREIERLRRALAEAMQPASNSVPVPNAITAKSGWIVG